MSELSEGHAAEQYLPENLRSLRARKGLSQVALAKEMSECGWPWHQSTVYKVEDGQRVLSFGEAADLARILGVSTNQLTWSGPEANEVAMVDRSIGMLRRAWHETAEAVHRLAAARASAERTLERSGDSKYERVRETCAELVHELGERTLESAFAEGEYRHENPEEEP